MTFIGPFCFGRLVGWVLYHLLRRRTEAATLSDLGMIIATTGMGATLVAVRVPSLWAFNAYAVGLVIGFFGYFVVALIIDRDGTGLWFQDLFQ